MIDEKYLDLINKEIDGMNSQEESALLKNYLLKNPEAGDLYKDLVEVSNMLYRVREKEPSPNLKKYILNSISVNKYAKKEKSELLKTLITSLLTKRNLKYAYVFSAGLIFGIIMCLLVIDKIYKETSFDISTLYGTMILDKTLRSFETADHIEINLDEVSGTIDIKFSKDIVFAELNLKTQQEIEMLFEFDEHDISFNGLRQLNKTRSDLSIGVNYLKLTNIGDNKCIIVFDDKTQSVTPMNFKIFSSGALLYEKIISTGRKSE